MMSQRRADDAPILRPLAAVGAVLALLMASFVCLVGTATGDAVTLTSRAAAFALPVSLGLALVAVSAAFVRRGTWQRRRRPMVVALGMYLALLCVAGFATAASDIGISGPPPMPSTASPR